MTVARRAIVVLAALLRIGCAGHETSTMHQAAQRTTVAKLPHADLLRPAPASASATDDPGGTAPGTEQQTLGSPAGTSEAPTKNPSDGMAEGDAIVPLLKCGLSPKNPAIYEVRLLVPGYTLRYFGALSSAGKPHPNLEPDSATVARSDTPGDASEQTIVERCRDIPRDKELHIYGTPSRDEIRTFSNPAKTIVFGLGGADSLDLFWPLNTLISDGGSGAADAHGPERDACSTYTTEKDLFAHAEFRDCEAYVGVYDPSANLPAEKCFVRATNAAGRVVHSVEEGPTSLPACTIRASGWFAAGVGCDQASVAHEEVVWGGKTLLRNACAHKSSGDRFCVLSAFGTSGAALARVGYTSVTDRTSCLLYAAAGEMDRDLACGMAPSSDGETVSSQRLEFGSETLLALGCDDAAMPVGCVVGAGYEFGTVHRTKDVGMQMTRARCLHQAALAYEDIPSTSMACGHELAPGRLTVYQEARWGATIVYAHQCSP